MAYISGNGPQRQTLSARFTEIFTAFSEAAAKRRVYRDTLNELSALSPRELNDLGINPSMLKSIASEAAYGKGA